MHCSSCQVETHKKKYNKKHHKKNHKKSDYSSEYDHKKCNCRKDKDCKHLCHGLLGCCAVCYKGECRQGVLTADGCLLNDHHKKHNKHHKKEKHHKHYYYKQYEY